MKRTESQPLKTVFSFADNPRPARFAKLACHLLVCFVILFGRAAYANDFVWLANPVDNNWNNPANWSPGTVPGPYDAVYFGTSSIRKIEIAQGTGAQIFFFDANAEAFTFTALPGVAFTIKNSVVNDSSVEQNFVSLADESGSASFDFHNSVPGQGTITGPVTFTQHPFNAGDAYPPSVSFFFTQGAGGATFHNLGATVAGGVGGRTDFFYAGASAEQSTIINEGGTVAGARGGATQFVLESPTAARATLIANGGTNGGGGGSFTFWNSASGKSARVELFGNGYLDISYHQSSTFTIGSLEGDGIVFLGRKALTVGSTSLSTTFSGLLQAGTPDGGSGTGALSKIGGGTLTLSGPSVYTDGTTVIAGTLVVSNTSGSASGTGPVSVTAGTLGGSGIIAGPVTVGTGSGSGAFLAPAHGENKQLTLTIQSALTFNADSTYTYTFKAKRNKSKTDKVVANGVTINSGASIDLSGQAQGTLMQGIVLTLIKNTAATPIAGAFSNLPDGGIVNVNGNNFQASYSGGDGNDLTLTVVP